LLLSTMVQRMYLLNIQSSPRRTRSASIAVADAFLEAYRQVCPEVIVDNLNVWQENLPEFDQEAIGAKYKGINQEQMNATEQKVWDRIQELVARFKRADRIVIGVPMWNFAYPYKLKQLIDLVAQRNLLFTYDGQEYGPLLKTPRALLILTRGGAFAEDLPTPPSRFDHQRGYLEFWLPLVGVREVETLVVETTSWRGEEKGKNSVEQGKEAARELAVKF
jgi:FMN-dependent NADH-azoreductase